MKRILIASTALAIFATPLQAQLLGGGGFGGLGGGLGGAVGGTLGGMGSIGSTTDSIRGATRGTLEGSGNASGSAKADRRSGKVDANGQGGGSGAISQLGVLDTPAGSNSASGSAAGSASGSGSASAQLIGTDAVRSAVDEAGGVAQGSVQQGQSLAQGLAGSTDSLTGNVQGTTSGALAGSGSYTAGPLAAAGSLAAQGDGAFSVERGTPIFAADGDRIGRVRQVVSDARGNVEQLLVRVDGAEAMLPASAFEASGSGLLSVMGEGQIKQIARQQEEADQSAS